MLDPVGANKIKLRKKEKKFQKFRSEQDQILKTNFTLPFQHNVVRFWFDSHTYNY